MLDPFATWRALQAASTDRTSRLDAAVDLAFWETVAERYDCESLACRVPAVVERVLARIGRGKRVLDLGCGTGSFALPIAAAGNWVTALDYSPAMLAVFRRKLPATEDRIRLIEGRIEDADLPVHDIVLAANSLYRIADIEPVIARLNALAGERVIVVWSVGRAPAWKQHARNRIRPGRYQPGVDYIHLAAALWAAGYDPAIEIVTVPVRECYPDLDSAAQALIDWAAPDRDELAAARAVAREIFHPAADGLMRPSIGSIAILTWTPSHD
ncbi:MAG: methyltransferase domain-containing protein [Chloroflexota bacterium]|nr:methyltransferase domain-containing protein [Dehalococcoidia bacterium]MDW8252503.1 methyltransferase domain-containing protein [Chloroflexota bacterium]